MPPKRALPKVALWIGHAIAVVLLAIYSIAVRSLLVGVILGMVALLGILVGGVIGFLFAIPREVSLISRLTIAAGAPSSVAGEGEASEYAPSTKMNEIADWLLKMVVGAGLAGAGRIGTVVSGLGEQLAAVVTPAPPGASFVTQLLLFAFVILGFGSVFLWTRIRYSALQTLADRDIRSEVASLRSEVSSNRAKAEETASGLKNVQRVARWLAGRDKARTEEFHEERSAHPQALRYREQWPQEVREAFTSFQNGSTDWEADPAAEFFPNATTESKERRLEVDLLVEDKGSVVFEARVIRTGGEPLSDSVTFLLHPSLDDPVLQVEPESDVCASVLAYADGWFTVVAIADSGRTVLSRSLRELRGAPATFTAG